MIRSYNSLYPTKIGAAHRRPPRPTSGLGLSLRESYETFATYASGFTSWFLDLMEDSVGAPVWPCSGLICLVDDRWQYDDFSSYSNGSYTTASNLGGGSSLTFTTLGQATADVIAIAAGWASQTWKIRFFDDNYQYDDFTSYSAGSGQNNLAGGSNCTANVTGSGWAGAMAVNSY